MEIIQRDPSPSVQFRFYADFEIDIELLKSAKLTPQQSRMLQAVGASPASMREVGRLALLTDLAGITGEHFNGVFEGPSDEAILQSMLPWLPSEDKAYWEELQRGPEDALAFELMPVFLVFRVTLRRAGVEEMTSLPGALKTNIGPTIESTGTIR